MTTVRIAHVEPRPGRQPDGGFRIHSFLIVLAAIGWGVYEVYQIGHPAPAKH